MGRWKTAPFSFGSRFIRSSFQIVHFGAAR
jgi:hypothetical protein